MAGKFLDIVQADFPELKFKKGRKFAFLPPRSVILGPEEPFWELLTLHEVSHAVLGHKTFKTDVERLKMEAETWDKTCELAKKYNVSVDMDFIQGELDTYRDWLHKKSRCPVCGLTRFQTPDSQYHCPACECFKRERG